jgi:hypothetical protein
VLLVGYPPTVTFTTPDPVNLPVPSQRYLGLHAACCKVARLSGAAEAADLLYRDLETTKSLAEDGSSRDILQRLTSLVAVML